jgi:hypothetical protein
MFPYHERARQLDIPAVDAIIKFTTLTDIFRKYGIPSKPPEFLLQAPMMASQCSLPEQPNAHSLLLQVNTVVHY